MGEGAKKSVPIGADVEWWPFFQVGGGEDLRRIAIEAKRPPPQDKIYQFLALVCFKLEPWCCPDRCKVTVLFFIFYFFFQILWNRSQLEGGEQALVQKGTSVRWEKG